MGVYIHQLAVITSEGVFCLRGRGISFVGVVFTSVGVVFPLRACFHLHRRGYNF